MIFYPTLSSIQSINTHTVAAMEVGYSALLQMDLMQGAQLTESSRCYIFESTITGNAFPKLLLSVEKSKSIPREVDIPEFPWYGRDKNKESQGCHIMEWVYRIRPADPPDDSVPSPRPRGTCW